MGEKFVMENGVLVMSDEQMDKADVNRDGVIDMVDVNLIVAYINH